MAAKAKFITALTLVVHVSRIRLEHNVRPSLASVSVEHPIKTRASVTIHGDKLGVT